METLEIFNLLYTFISVHVGGTEIEWGSSLLLGCQKKEQPSSEQHTNSQSFLDYHTWTAKPNKHNWQVSRTVRLLGLSIPHSFLVTTRAAKKHSKQMQALIQLREWLLRPLQRNAICERPFFSHFYDFILATPLVWNSHYCCVFTLPRGQPTVRVRWVEVWHLLSHISFIIYSWISWSFVSATCTRFLRAFICCSKHPVSGRCKEAHPR